MPVLSASSTAVQQLIAFLEALALGMIYASVYDLYRSVRAQFRRLPFTVSFIADCCFWVAAAAATVLFMLHRRWGEIYVYTYAALAGGFIIYFYYFSNHLLPLWQKVLAFVLSPWRSCGVPAGNEPIKKKMERYFRACRIFHPFRRK